MWRGQSALVLRCCGVDAMADATWHKHGLLFCLVHVELTLDNALEVLRHSHLGLPQVLRSAKCALRLVPARHHLFYRSGSLDMTVALDRLLLLIYHQITVVSLLLVIADTFAELVIERRCFL